MPKKFYIEQTGDSSDCECCGDSYAAGYNLIVDDSIFIELKPFASCFDSDDYHNLDLIAATMNKLLKTDIPCGEDKGQVSLECILSEIAKLAGEDWLEEDWR